MRVGALGKLEHQLAPLLVLEVGRDRRGAAALGHVELLREHVGGAGAVDAQDLGTHVCEQHRGERAGT